jgi:hypothetical protein
VSIPTADQVTESNVENSVSIYLATLLLGANYLVYWHQSDALQTPDGWYFNYSALQTTYLADATLHARVVAAAGLITLRGDISAIPRYVTRPSRDGTVAGQDEVPIPLVAIEIGPSISLRNYEMGNRPTKWRRRHCMLTLVARDRAEQKALTDRLAVWFDDGQWIDIKDHDSGTLSTITSVQVVDQVPFTAVSPDDAEALTYVSAINAWLEYVA